MKALGAPIIRSLLGRVRVCITLTVAAFAFVPAGAASAAWQVFSLPDTVWGKPIPRLLDRQGVLYVDTGGAGNPGIFAFDGETWSRLQVAGNLVHRWASAVVDSAGNTWLIGAQLYPASVTAILKSDGPSWSVISEIDGHSTSEFKSALVSRSGVLWLGGSGPSGGFLYSFDGTTWAPVAGPSPELSAILHCEDASGHLWSSGPGRVTRIDGAAWTNYAVPGTALGIQQDRAGGMWVATREAVGRLVGGLFVDATPPGSQGLLTSIVRDRDGTVWITTDVSIGYHDGHKWRWHSDELPAFVGRLNGGMTDESGAFWYGSGSHWFYRFDGASSRDFTAVDGIDPVSEPLYSAPQIFCGRNGDVWVIQGPQGVARFDGNTWTRYRQADGLASDVITTIHEDRSGAVWFGSYDGGITRLSDGAFTRFTTADGMGSNYVSRILDDTHGNLWAFGTPWNSSFADTISRFDGTRWWIYPPGDSLPFWGSTYAMTDSRGNLWCAGIDSLLGFAAGAPPLGLFRFDGSRWTQFRDHVVPRNPEAPSHLWEDTQGRLWFTNDAGSAYFDGDRWIASAIGANPYSERAFLDDGRGSLWFAQGNVIRLRGSSRTDYTSSFVGVGSSSLLSDRSGGVWAFYGQLAADGSYACRFDGSRFIPSGRAPGQIYPGNGNAGLLTDSTGALWFKVELSLMRHYPDRTPPTVRYLTKPAAVTSSATLTASFSMRFEPPEKSEFSYRLDGGPWSEWSVVGSWSQDHLPDGLHALEVQARDYWGNISAHPVVARFEVDATPPTPLISSPKFGDPVRGTVEIRGVASDLRFANYRIALRPSGASTWDAATILEASTSAIADGALTEWNTSTLPDGSYDLRLTVADSLGLVGTALTTVVVDNHAPFFDETAPTKVAAASGGDVYTTNAETHLYFPPHAFAQDAVVMVASAEAGSVPGSLPSGATKVLDGYEIAWAGTLGKQARFTMSYASATPPAGTLALYRSTDGTNWERLGGTVDPTARSISLAVTLPGRYALFADNGLGAGTASLSGIAFTPRVFSPSGSFADQEVGISFRLGKPAPVTVKVFSKSGRLIREVATGQELNAGDNLIRWDGRDRNGGIVVDGMYLVTVEALGQTETKTLAVVK